MSPLDKPPLESTSRSSRIGLCETCLHARRIESDRGSLFFQCKLSFEDARFPKYPQLPVLKCSGYQPQ